MALDMVKDFISKEETTPMQQSIVIPKTNKEKDEVERFTVEIEKNLMKTTRIFAVTEGIKLRQLFEQALSEYLENHKND